MNAALEKLFTGKPVLCDGAMGTMLYSCGVFINRCYDELNVTQPEMVRSVHEQYLLAGASLARQCVTAIREKQATDAYVAGAVGSLGVRLEPFGTLSPAAARAAFAEQIAALAEGGVDLLVMETMMSLDEAEQAIAAAREVAPNLPVIALMTVDEEANCLDGSTPEQAAHRLSEAGADAIGCNCSVGPATVLTAIERMRPETKLPLVAMPNAGMPRNVEGRNIYLTSPDYLARFARRAIRAGASWVGGCCGTTPAHIRAMRSEIRAMLAQDQGVVSVGTGVHELPEEPEVEPKPLAERSEVGRRVAAGEFVHLVEIVPPKGFDCSKELAGAALLASRGVHAINVPDSPRASARMSAQSLCLQIQQKVGIETVLHYTCRDRNILSIQSDLLGAASIGIKNILCLTGDPPKLGNYPDATAVFDVDAIGLARIVRGLNHGLDIGKNSIGGSTGFTISVAANPGVPDIDYEVRRFAAKVEAGAEFCITQPVFDQRLLEEFLRRIEGFRIPVIAGIWPLTSLRNAEFMKNDLRVSMPDSILARMAEAPDKKSALAVGLAIAQEMLAEVRDQVQGVQVSAPFNNFNVAAEVLGLRDEATVDA